MEIKILISMLSKADNPENRGTLKLSKQVKPDGVLLYWQDSVERKLNFDPNTNVNDIKDEFENNTDYWFNDESGMRRKPIVFPYPLAFDDPTDDNELWKKLPPEINRTIEQSVGTILSLRFSENEKNNVRLIINCTSGARELRSFLYVALSGRLIPIFTSRSLEEKVVWQPPQLYTYNLKTNQFEEDKIKFVNEVILFEGLQHITKEYNFSALRNAAAELFAQRYEGVGKDYAEVLEYVFTAGELLDQFQIGSKDKISNSIRSMDDLQSVDYGAMQVLNKMKELPSYKRLSELKKRGEVRKEIKAALLKIEELYKYIHLLCRTEKRNLDIEEARKGQPQIIETRWLLKELFWSIRRRRARKNDSDAYFLSCRFFEGSVYYLLWLYFGIKGRSPLDGSGKEKQLRRSASIRSDLKETLDEEVLGFSMGLKALLRASILTDEAKYKTPSGLIDLLNKIDTEQKKNSFLDHGNAPLSFDEGEQETIGQILQTIFPQAQSSKYDRNKHPLDEDSLNILIKALRVD